MTNLPAKIKVAVVGQNGVGKSAVTVRYLTKRFISEYSSLNDFLYKHSVCFDEIPYEVEILDTCNHGNSYENWADSFLVVYSIVDRESFKEAEKILKHLAKLKLPSYYTTLLIGNKNDLDHLRLVSAEEAQKLCKLYNCQFFEVSAADNYAGVSLAFQSLIRDARSANLQRSLPIRRKLGVNTVGVNFSKALGNIFGKNNKTDRKRPSLSI